MLVRLLGTALVAAMCGFALLVVCAMLVRLYGGGGPVRSLADAVIRVPTTDIARIMNAPSVWMEQNL